MDGTKLLYLETYTIPGSPQFLKGPRVELARAGCLEGQARARLERSVLQMLVEVAIIQATLLKSDEG